jgi:hypothetical protein
VFILAIGCESQEKRLEREAQAALAEVMLDPTAILTRKLRLGRSDDGKEAICGEVNGKNRFGAFVGFKAFVSTREEPSTVAIDQDISPYDSDRSIEDRVSQTLYNGMYERYCETPSEEAQRKKLEDLLRDEGGKEPAKGNQVNKSPLVPKVVDSMPVVFRGEWTTDPSECGNGLHSNPIIISRNDVSFYESGGVPSIIKETGPNRVFVTVPMHGEGDSWTDNFTFIVSDDGKRLWTEDDPTEVRYKC